MISVRYTRIKTAFLILCLVAFLCSCTEKTEQLAYGTLQNNEAYSLEPVEKKLVLDLFAGNLAAVSGNRTDSSSMDTAAFSSAALYDITDKEVLYSFDACERVEPASLTKLMTALIVLEKCSRLDDIITIGDVNINEEGVQRFGLKKGDRVSIRGLLQIMLIHSGNDAALALAQYTGSLTAKENDRGRDPVTVFTDLMNARAAELGCSGTHFDNPHGLSDDDHYSTVYDLYIILDKLSQNEDFKSIASMPSCTVKYSNSEGEVVEKTVTNTNQFLTGAYHAPEGVTILGGKTGSTAAAGKCLIVLAQNDSGKSYIAAVTGASDYNTLYGSMAELLKITIQ